MRIAAIDIGTVTTRLLVAEYAPGLKIDELYRKVVVTQLGEGMAQTGRLSETGIQRVAVAIAGFVEKIADLRVDMTHCVATSAAREATNAEELSRVLAVYALKLDIIAGEEEARLSFAGATYERCGTGLLVVDPGGGSTEYVLGDIADETKPAQLRFARSLRVGSRRLTDLYVATDPPRTRELDACRAYIHKQLAAELEPLRGAVSEMTAVAGTATTLVTLRDGIEPYSIARVQGARVSHVDVKELLELLCSVPLAVRKRLRGLEPNRASVIIAGILIIDETLNFLELESFRVSDTDLLYGIILNAQN